MRKIRTGLSAALIIISYCLIGLYHLWTAILAYTNYGTFWGVLALFAPIVSELFLNGVYIAEQGFFNTYTLAILGLFILYGIGILIAPKE